MANKITVTIKVDSDKYQQIKEHYSSYFTFEQADYLDYSAKVNEELTIKGYLSSKSKQKVLFIGESALLEAQKWDETASINVKNTTPLQFVDYGEQIGSDEVGVGDFYLPMIVVAAYINKHQYQRLKELGVMDSKKLNDKKILEIGELLVKEFEYSKLTLSNEKYNEMIAKGENINSLKAKMHNRALANLHNKYIDVIAIYVDQFVNEDKYYKYLTIQDEPIVRGISFRPKGESLFPCVALASVIARYYFLKEKEKLEAKYGLIFPFGASKKADEFKKVLLEKVGQDEFDKLVKKNFKNYSK